MVITDKIMNTSIKLDRCTLPSISVVTPNYNYSDYVCDTIESVIYQGYPNLEYIVLDDGSTDNSFSNILKYKAHIAHCEQHKNVGQAATLNKGFTMSSGEIMAWLNSDDKYFPWTFSVVAEIFTAFPEVEWITGIPTLWSPNGNHVKVVGDAHKNIYDYLLGRYAWIQQESVFWRRSLWEKSGAYIDESFKFQIDCELWTRFFRHAELWHVDCCLGGYRGHSGTRSSNNMAETHREAKLAIEKLSKVCDRRILQDINVLRALSNMNFMASLVNMDSVVKFGFSQLSKRAAYKLISWEYEACRWCQITKPFKLF